MRYRKLDANGDYVFGHSQQDFLINTDAVSQAILTRLKLLLGEWWEDISDGLPLFQSILGVANTTNNKQTADILIQDRILNTQGVLNIENYSSSVDSKTRQFTVKCNVNTIYGTTATLEVNF